MRAFSAINIIPGPFAFLRFVCLPLYYPVSEYTHFFESHQQIPKRTAANTANAQWDHFLVLIKHTTAVAQPDMNVHIVYVKHMYIYEYRIYSNILVLVRTTVRLHIMQITHLLVVIKQVSEV